MKKTITLLAFLMSTFIFAQTTSIPDPNFEQALIDEGIDTNGLNGNILNSDAQGVVILTINSKNISDMTGIEAFINLTNLYCTGNNLTSLDVTNNVNLENLVCWGNTISSLNVSTNVNLYNLSCEENNLSALDITNNTALQNLFCGVNPLTSLDLSGNPILRKLDCGVTQIANLDFSNNPIFEELYYYQCQLTALDLSNVPLTRLQCSNGILTSLNVRNGNNTNVTFFSITNNPNLTCIDVDDVAYSNTNWGIDPQASFSTDCANLSVNTNNITNLQVYPNPVNAILTIKNITDLEVKRIEIFNLVGQKVWSKPNYTETINVSNLHKGVYFLAIQTNSNTIIKQFVKK